MRRFPSSNGATSSRYSRCRTPRPRSACAIGLSWSCFFSTGLRIAELVALNVDQVGFLNDKNSTRTYELPIVGKGKHIRTIFISPRAAEWLRAYLTLRRDAYDPLFLNHRAHDIGDDADATRLSARSIQKMISRAALLAGLSKKVTPHTLRHTYATDLLS